MKVDWEERHAAMKELFADCEKFWAQADAKTHSVPELIDQFLKSIVSSLSEHERLRSFAHIGYGVLGWTGFCQIYEYILANDPDGEARHATYAGWIIFGESFMKDAEGLSLEERVRVATDVEALIERAAQETCFCPEQVLGYFYYHHPLKAEQPQVYLLKSKEWFDRLIEARDGDIVDHHDFQYLGHLYFELGDFRTALSWYKKLETVENQCGDACVMDRALAENRLIECQLRLSESDS